MQRAPGAVLHHDVERVLLLETLDILYNERVLLQRLQHIHLALRLQYLVIRYACARVQDTQAGNRSVAAR